ncbi:MAG: GPR endopeptidase, partial [Anaerotignaceae bacterium]
KDFYKMLNEIKDEDRYDLIYNVLTPYAGNMFVTPKEVDAVIDRLSKIIAGAINQAVHPKISADDLNLFVS